VLSHQAATWTCLSETRCSSTKEWISMPAIFMSELGMVPVGLSNDTTFCWMSVGHSTRQTKGERARRPASHTPPAPGLEASQYPMYPGSQWVGRVPRTFTMVRKSSRASLKGVFVRTRM
jgi:hypothetical protein